MKIAFIDIQNFRKLRSVRIELSEKQTIFVGANNSGKTSAMHALDKFLNQSKERNDPVDSANEESNRWFVVEDFTLSLWDKINALGEKWEKFDPDHDGEPNFSLSEWDELLPSLDIWLEVQANEYNYVHKLIPTLDWEGGLLGIRLRLEPKKDLSALFNDYRLYRHRAQNNLAKAVRLRNKETASPLSDGYEYMQCAFWPKDMKDFLSRRLPNYFSVRHYELDPNELSFEKDSEGNWQKPQPLPAFSFAQDGDPFAGIIKVDAINAQRGFEDADTSKNQKLASQFYDYFRTHLNPEQNPEPKDSDIEAVLAVAKSEQLFDSSLQASFAGPINELKDLGYPGVYSPDIQVRTKVQRKDVLNHAAAVQYSLNEAVARSSERYLPEAYNGLGYQNLISMVFRLMRFRDSWMQTNKETSSSQLSMVSPEPIHLVFVEEPEAHLHAQVQQVFIRKAHNVLRNHKNLRDDARFTTQLIVSTHSSHIAHECEFADIRYFQRIPPSTTNDVPQARVVNLSTVFATSPDKGKKKKCDHQQNNTEASRKTATREFIARYLKTTHCDLFFADAAIFIEGAGERMLLPHFIKNFENGELSCCYISLLEIGGSHAFRLKELVELLGLTTLIITDIDSVKLNSAHRLSACPITEDAGIKTANSTLKSWLPCKEMVADLLSLPDAGKESTPKSIGAAVRVAYQKPISVELNGDTKDICPRTFEDALILCNFELFKQCDENSDSPQLSYLKEKINASISHEELQNNIFNLIIHDDLFNKAKFALEVLFNIDTGCLNIPNYIAEGLLWLYRKMNLPNLQCSTPTPSEAEQVQAEVVE